MIQPAPSHTTNLQRAEARARQLERFMEIYQPGSRREEMIIADLAETEVYRQEFEADYQLWLQFQATEGLEQLLRQEAEDYLKLLRQWPKAPAVVAPIVGLSLPGAQHLADLWKSMATRLDPNCTGPVPGMDMACQALLALGFSDKIQNLSEEGWWWATRLLAVQADTDKAIAAWLRRARPIDRDNATQLARHKLYHAPEAAMARQELFTEVTRLAEYWAGQRDELKQAEPARRDAQLVQARCMAVPNRGLAACLNNSGKLRESYAKEIKYNEERLARARKDKVKDEIYESKCLEFEASLPNIFSPEPAAVEPDQTTSPTVPEPTLEEMIEFLARNATDHSELLSRYLAPAETSSDNLAPSPAAHTSNQQPSTPARPMSNRKKRLARMAAKENKAKTALLPALV